MQDGGERRLDEPGCDAKFGIRHMLLAAQSDVSMFFLLNPPVSNSDLRWTDRIGSYQKQDMAEFKIFCAARKSD